MITRHPPGARVALVHEWLASRAGSEKTFEQMTKVLPDADVYALTVDSATTFDIARPVHATVLQRIPVLRDKRNLSLPMMPLAWKSLRTPVYDTVVTSSHAFARYLPAARAARIHLSYVYTPLRYAWLPSIDDRVARPWLAPARLALRRLDRRTVDGVTEFAGISRAVCDRIGEYYGREARVIYPPVDIDFFRDDAHAAARRDRASHEEPYLLGFSRWIPYKRLDLVIAAGERLGMPVVIAGHGPGEPELRALAERASVPVRFECRPSDVRLRELYRNAAAFLFPAEEDFGIVPVECQAAGTPVVAYARGGSLDTVRDGVTGALVESQDADAFADGTRRALALSLDREAARGHVEQFSSRAFRRSFATWLSEWVDDELAA